MGNLFGNILSILFLMIWILVIIRIIVQKFLSKEKEVFATVVNKQCFEKQVLSNMSVPRNVAEYVIIFQSGKKRLYFNVSAASFEDYHINQKGKLKYKGKKIIDFTI